MENFYKFFESKRKVEIDLSLFEEAMTAVSVPREFAGDMFRAFDIDMSGTLSLKEIAVGEFMYQMGILTGTFQMTFFVII